MKYIKSPLNYTGGKYKLLNSLFDIFPNNINTFVDLFAGGFNVGINVNANKIICNDQINYLIELYEFLEKSNTEEVINNIYKIINEFQLSKSNADGYNKLRERYNENKDILESDMYNYTDVNTAEIIYFPTGGGKTEAFLGTVILSCFYDRFIGKKYGVNTIIKYPLRLLSIQQLERTLDAIEMANNVLKENEEIKDLPIFTLGYFVGSSNTPNEIKDEEISKCEHNSDYVLVDKCPVCGENIVNGK